MNLDRKLLSELHIDETAVQLILAAHQEAVDALNQSASQHRQEAEQVRGELDAYRREVEMERVAQARQGVIRDALTRAGANEQAVPLLALAVSAKEEDWDGAALRDEDAVLAPVCQACAGFFSQPIPLPTDIITPPLEGSDISLEDVRRMSPNEINENWSVISSALMQR